MGRTSEFFDGLKATIIENLIAKAFDPAHAHTAATVAIETLHEMAAGDQIYIPTRYWQKLDARDWEIWEAFNGNNQAELGRRFGLTERQVYARLNIIRPIAIRKAQGNLFGEGEDA